MLWGSFFLIMKSDLNFLNDDKTLILQEMRNATKMTVKQLQAMAKQNGIGIAKTKPDFLRIIKKKNHEDLDQLLGKTCMLV